MSDDDDGGGSIHQLNISGDGQASSHSDQTIDQSHSLSPSQLTIANGNDDVSTTTPVAIKLEQDRDFNCPSPSSPTSHVPQQNLASKATGATNLPISSSSNKRLTGTLNRLLNSVINRPNGHHYHHLNGSSSSPSASSSTATTAAANALDSTAKEPKTSLEMSTPSIESKSFVDHGPHRSCLTYHFQHSYNTSIVLSIP